MTPAESVRETAELLIRMKLVPAAQVEEFRRLLQPDDWGDELLAALGSKNLLTSYQIERLRKSNHEGLVLGDYKLLYKNASGSFARVYRGASIHDNSSVGLKLLRERWSNDPETVRLFHREGEVGQRLKHVNIVPIYDVAQQGNQHYFTMEFVEGGNLRDFIKIRGKLSVEEACRVTLDMSRALEYALGQGVTHRDLKMTNVLMSSQGVAKLIDFGLATDEHYNERSDGPDMAQALEYSTFERAIGVPWKDPSSDLYFLGGILYELLTGRPPYPRTKSREERKDPRRYLSVRPIEIIDPMLPQLVTMIVGRLMQTDLDLRYVTPSEVVRDLQKVVGNVTGPVVLKAAPKGQPTVLCVESRTKQQDVLRKYFPRYGYKVLLVSDAERAILRCKAAPPDCCLLMGDVIGDGIVDALEEICSVGQAHRTATVVVFAKNQQHLAERVPINPLIRTLVLPINLGDLRREIDGGLAARKAIRR